MDAQEKDTQEVEILETDIQKEDSREEKKTSTSRRVLMIIGIVLSVIFGFTLACNLTIIIKGALYPDDPPSVLGATPLVVLTGSMSGSAPGHIESGDLVFVDKIEAEELKVGDVIAYKSGKSIVLHRIVEVQTTEYGTLKFYTKGDANNTADLDPVYSDKIVGILTYRVPGIGHFIMFTQTIGARFKIVDASKGVEFESHGSAEHPMMQLTVRTNNYSGYVHISWGDGVIPDKTDPLLAIADAATGFVRVYLSAHSEYTFTFLKSDLTQDLSSTLTAAAVANP